MRYGKHLIEFTTFLEIISAKNAIISGISCTVFGRFCRKCVKYSEEVVDSEVVILWLGCFSARNKQNLKHVRSFLGVKCPHIYAITPYTFLGFAYRINNRQDKVLLEFTVFPPMFHADARNFLYDKSVLQENMTWKRLKFLFNVRMQKIYIFT